MKLKKVKKIPISRYRNKLWELCKSHARNKINSDRCFTCDRIGLSGSNQQTGHFIPSACGGALLRYHPNNLRIQCFHCNINLGSNGSEYYRRLVRDIGQKEVDKLFVLKERSISANTIFYQKMIELYTSGDEKQIIKYLENLK